MVFNGIPGLRDGHGLQMVIQLYVLHKRQGCTESDSKRNKDKLYSERLRQRGNRERKEGYEEGEEKVVQEERNSD